MQIACRCFDVLVAHQNLDGSQVRSVFSMCVAKQWRRVWGVTCFWIPAFRAASCTHVRLMGGCSENE